MSEPQVLAPPSPADIRAELKARLLANIVGPEGGEHEELDTGAVREYYLVGMLAPRVRAESDAEAFDGQQDTLAVEGPSDVEESAPDVGAPPPGHQLVPSSLGMTFGVTSNIDEIRLDAHWGRYERVTQDSDAETPKRVWRRTPAGGNCDVALRPGAFGPVAPDPAQPEVVLRGRMRSAGGHWVVTVFLVNNQSEQKVNKDEAWAFQAQVGAEDAAGRAIFLRPWERRADGGDNNDVGNTEAAALDMAYRNDVELAVGHATGVHVVRDPSDRRQALRVETTAVPVAEVAATVAPGAADIPELAQVTLDMAELAVADDEQLAKGLRPLVSAYRSWIGHQQARIGEPGEHLEGFEEVASSTLAHADRAANRIEAGIDLLDPASGRHNPDASEAFRFANRAMWQQRVRSQAAEHRLADPAADHDAILAAADRPENHSWRPFQLGFVLVNLPSLADPGHTERGPGDEGLVDLLWFPTGGGKTEAYLGLAAFTLAIRRLQGSIGGYDGTDGVGVLMRYTLRLLTVQQFQRAAALICGCEVIRREAAAGGDLRWGEVPFRLGLWVGAKVTPTRTAQAARSISEAKHSAWYGGGSSPVKVTACPWCGASVDAARDAESDGVRGRTLVFCGDPMGRCPFSRRGAPGEGLPLVTVDHEIYRLVPSMVIATADKFAQLSWEGATRALFGRVTRRCERHGYRHPDLDQLLAETDSHRRRGAHPEARTVITGPLRPPDLIIQDELHLIAGPLGSLMGLYETAIDHLSTWSLGGRVVRPKVVASTATVRRADVQARQVFWRSLDVFPPPGLDATDSFFALQRDPAVVPGRLYVGVCAPGKRIKAVEIRLYVALLGAGQALFERYGEAVDPWMTLVGYFSALRELAGMRRMVDDDVSTRLAHESVAARGLARRYLGQPRELTSRMDSATIPDVLDQLGLPFRVDSGAQGLTGAAGGGRAAEVVGRGRTAQPRRSGRNGRQEVRPIDVLLATNMISVGVDVPRLGLMVVGGQPKAAAEYIQATSRVGRSSAGPGLVVTALNWYRPRDQSHYEGFEHFHATFYRHVEALSVTPFSPRCVDRGLSALAVAMVRHSCEEANSNAAAQSIDPHEAAIRMDIVTLIRSRAEALTGRPEVGDALEAALERRLDSWTGHQLHESAVLGYRERPDGRTVGLMRPPGEGTWGLWSCPMSLREVEAGINLLLLDDVADEDGAGGTGRWGDYELPEVDRTRNAPKVSGDEESAGGAETVAAPEPVGLEAP